MTVPAGSGNVPVTAANVFKDRQPGSGKRAGNLFLPAYDAACDQAAAQLPNLQDSNREGIAVPDGFKCVGLTQ